MDEHSDCGRVAASWTGQTVFGTDGQPSVIEEEDWLEWVDGTETQMKIDMTTLQE